MHIKLNPTSDIANIELPSSLDPAKTDQVEQKIKDLIKLVTDNFDTLQPYNITFDLENKKVTIEGLGEGKSDLALIEDLTKKILSLGSLAEDNLQIEITQAKQLTQSDKKTVLQSLRRFFLFHLLVNPSMKRHIAKELKDIDPKDYRKEFVKLLDSGATWVEDIKTKHPSLTNLYSKEELQFLHEKNLEARVNLSLKDSPLKQSEIKKFKIDQTFNRLCDPNCPTAFLEQELYKIQAMYIPLEKLQAVPITPENKEILSKTWERILAEAYSHGNLSNLDTTTSHKERLVRADYATIFVAASERAPPELALDDRVLVDNLLETASLEALEKLILEDKAFYGSSIPFADPTLVEKQKLYVSKIKPMIDLQLTSKTNTADAEKMFLYLANSHIHLNDLFEKLDKALSEEEAKIFSEEELEDLFYNRIYKVAIQEYHLTSSQIENLQNLRVKEVGLAEKRIQLKESLSAYAKEFNALHTKNIKDKKPVAAQEDSQQALIDSYVKKILDELSDEERYPDVFKSLLATKITSPVIEEVFYNLSEQLLNTDRLSIINNSPDAAKVEREIELILNAKEQLSKFQESSNSARTKKLFTQFEANITNETAKKLLTQKSQDLYNASLYHLYLGDEVAAKVLEEDFHHPSNISPSVLSDLIILSRQIHLFDNTKSYSVSEDQKDKFIQCLNRLSNNPDMKDISKRFEGAREDEDTFLSDIAPLILQRFIPAEKKEQYKIPAGVTRDALDLVEYYSKMMKTYNSLSAPLERGEKLLAKYKENPSQITDKDRLTYKEISQLSRLSRFSKATPTEVSIMEILRKLGMSDHPSLKDCLEKTGRAVKITNQLDNILIPAYSKHLQDGDILGYVGKRKEAWTGRSLPTEQKLTTFITDYGLLHGMKAYHATNNQINVSHVYGNHENDPLDLFNMVISDTWRLNISSLVSSNIAKDLEKSLGIQWKDDVQTLYQEIERGIHQNIDKRFASITNRDVRRKIAGAATFHPIVNLFGGIDGKKVTGHKKLYEQDFSPIHKQFLEGAACNEDQICSEFVSKSTLAALMELNKQLAKKLAGQHPELTFDNILTKLEKNGVKLNNEMKDYLKGTRHFGSQRGITKEVEGKLRKILSSSGYSKKEIELAFRINNEEIFDLPYDRKERLKAIHPGRMISLLEKRKCVTKIEPPPEFRALIKVK